MTARLRLPNGIAACLFDLDGVITRTAEVHAAAWKQTFDSFLARHCADGATAARPFDVDGDYVAHVDGRPRADGVRTFLASRGIALPEGTASDPPSADTVHEVGRRKNELVQELIARDGVAAYEGSVRFLAATRAAGLACALVTSSENGSAVLNAAALEHAFEVTVDGAVANELGLAGKPAPDVFLEATRRLEVAPARAAVFEDALAGIAAGSAGGFGLVVGVDRIGQPDELRAAGADIVVEDLAELLSER
ncbi:MAG: beta-phosphoglucomutase family hydrolase [Solirubrobacteraceae bacterium]|nr:beta-phosphoglucomutase family hydrolase [Solirubrobacteraceae bacterium]